MRLVLCALLASLALPASAQRVLYASDAFTVTDSTVVEGDAQATAPSRTSVQSTYKDGAGHGMRRVVAFKFALNGADNERAPGEDHLVYLDPQDGRFVTPVYLFGASDPPEAAVPADAPAFLGQRQAFAVTFRVDLSPVLSAFDAHGYYETFRGERIPVEDFDGVYLAGGTAPLSWDFTNLPRDDRFRLTDPDGDGIYEVTVRFEVDAEREVEGGVATWTLSRDIGRYPQSRSPDVLPDALYRMALEELMQNIEADGTFRTGAEWPGVWTRDISYSIVLGLGLVEPEVARRSLLAKVRNGQIVQDTGTGGSWPVSTDRTTWALAAWELYAVTGDRVWLRTAYDITRRTAQVDLATAYDPMTGLFRGESSFLDWREQTYPRWMQPADIYDAYALGTNVVHYATYRLLAQMARELGEEAAAYDQVADGIRDGLATYLWQSDRGYHGQYRYGRVAHALSPRAELLGSALAVLYDAAPRAQQQRMLAETPLVPFGTPSVFPQTPDIPPYHNDGIWPFVQAFWTWAAATGGNAAAVEHGLGGLYRAAALFLTNKENFVATTGDFEGTVVNSDRQLWSVAGQLATVYRALYGLRAEPDRLVVAPFVPAAYAGTRTLSNLPWRDATLTIRLDGWGSGIAAATLDGTPLDLDADGNVSLPADLTGAHVLAIRLDEQLPPSTIQVVPNHTAPETPYVRRDGTRLVWDAVPGAVSYDVLDRGDVVATTTAPHADVDTSGAIHVWQVRAVDAAGYRSFLSEPVRHAAYERLLPAPGPLATDHAGYTGEGYRRLTPTTPSVVFELDVERPGQYAIEARYANGSGPINTDNKAAIRTLLVDDAAAGALVLPQRGADAWTDWGYSAPVLVRLMPGRHRLAVAFRPENQNMDGTVNEALLDALRVTLVDPD